MDISKIKENIINDIVDSYEIVGEITKNEVLTIMVERIKEDEFQPKVCEYTEDVEEENLFDRPVSSLCTYLKQLEDKFGAGELRQKWSGYKGNYFVYAYKGVEDEDMISQRIEKELYSYVEQYIIRKEKKQAKDNKIKELEEELRRLKNDEC